MATLVLLRGINVGGHRGFRPTLLARQLEEFDVTSIGATGTFIVRQPPSRATLRAALRTRLPAGTGFVLCEGRELRRLATEIPLGSAPPRSGNIRFVSFLARRVRVPPALPLTIPHGRDWSVRVTTLRNRFAVGEYRRHMKSIGCLGQLDAIFGTLVTTRSWTTVRAILERL